MVFQAAEYLAASAATGALSSSFPIYKVDGVSTVPSSIPAGGVTAPTNMMAVLMGALLITIVALVVGMGVFKTQGKGQVKKASGILWLPEGFLRKNRYLNVCTCQRLVLEWS